MTMSAMLSLAAMMRYRPDLLDNLHLPETPDVYEMGVEASQVRELWTIDAEQFGEYLAFKTNGMSLAVPDADWLKQAIGVWSATHFHEWQRMFDTLFYRYNPLWNKDSTITENVEDTHDTTDTQRPNITVTNHGQNIGYTHGYNDGSQTLDGLAWTHADRADGDTTNTTTGSQTLERDGTDSRERTVTEQGNVGVTQVQQMIDAERQTALYCVEDIIADDFKKEFCLMIW